MYKFLAFFFVLFLFSCSKEQQTDLDTEDDHLITRSSDSPRDLESNTRTILGEVKNNPFELQNMQAAYLSLVRLVGAKGINVSATHSLIKFTAANQEDYKKLMTDTSLILFDYPLNRKVIAMGDYYFESTSADAIPTMWGIVPVGCTLPNIPHEVVERYAYLHQYPSIVAESFRLTGLSQYTNDYISGDEWVDEDHDAIPNPNDIPYCGPGYEAYVKNPNDHPDQWIWLCRKVHITEGVNNQCGCPVPGNIKEPAGCVEVEIDAVDPEGVNRVSVIISDSWAQILRPIKRFTTDQGCWRTNKNYSKRVWVWIRFQNEFSYERSHRNWGHLQEFLAPIRNYVGVFGEPHNNIYRLYPKWTQQDTKEQIYWGAATVNNQVHEFRDWVAAQPGVAQIPKLDIYLVDDRRDGAAIMAGYRVSGLLYGTIIPDVTIGLNRGFFVNRRALLDRLSYHEFTHASHFMQVGEPWYNNLIIQEYNNSVQWDEIRNLFEGDPWGNGTEPGAGYVALAESWADNIMTDILNIPQEDLVFENGYIPMGLYEDLTDVNTNPIENHNNIIIRDNVGGFTREQLSNGMNLNTTTLDDYREFLRPLLPAGNNMQDFDNLFRITTYRRNHDQAGGYMPLAYLKQA